MQAFLSTIPNEIASRRNNYIWLIASGITSGNAEQVKYNKIKLEELEDLMGIIHGR